MADKENTMSDKEKILLVVEDGGEEGLYLSGQLCNEFNILLATNGAEADKQIKAHPEILLTVVDLETPREDRYDFLRKIKTERGFPSIPVIAVIRDNDEESAIRALDLGVLDVLTKSFNKKITLYRIKMLFERIYASRLIDQKRDYELLLKQSEIDEKTGIYTKHAFCRHVREILDNNPDEKYVLFRWDVDGFKRYNDMFGTAAGDKLLAKTGEYYKKHAHTQKDLVLYGHWDADHFVTLRRASDFDPVVLTETIRSQLLRSCGDYEFTPRAGIYIIDDPKLDAVLMSDRAYFAMRSIKDQYTTYYAYYDESMRIAFLEEHELVSEMESALAAGQFIVYYQPQYNYDNGSLIGAEALVRWDHPTKGLIPPGKFIPVFERNGSVTQLDIYVWEQVCIALRKWIDAGMKIVPVSVNISRRDIYYPRLSSIIFRLISKYKLSPSMLKLEITESAYVDNADQFIGVVKELQSMGFIVEMDDFGSGYSSLNTLKDVPIDILKLDVRFLSEGEDDSRGGSILSSVINMSHWLKLPVIAEGVETKKDADYLNSLNCIYMQGYYFAHPLPVTEFEKVLKKSTRGELDHYKDIDLSGIAAFWDSSSQNALIFNSLIGGAIILEYNHGSVEIKRANNRFFKEIGATREEYLEKLDNVLERFEKTNRMIFQKMLNDAANTGEEVECEVQSRPLRKGGRPFWTHLRAKLLSKNGEDSLIYVAVENVTTRRQLENDLASQAERNRIYMESTGVLFFDYDPSSDIMKAHSRTTEGEIRLVTIDGYMKTILKNEGIDPGDRERVKKCFARAIKEPTKLSIEYMSKRFSSEYSPCSLEVISSSQDGVTVNRIAGTVKEALPKMEELLFLEKILTNESKTNDDSVYGSTVAERVLALLSRTEEPEKVIGSILSAIGERLDVSRVYIIENDENGDRFTNTFEWCGEGVSPEIGNLQNIEYPYEFKNGRYFQLFGEDGIISSSDISLLPQSIRDVLEPQGIKAIIHCAMFDDGKFKGYLGFDECRCTRPWSNNHIRILTMVSQLIGVFLFKRRRQEQNNNS